jgi:23S rRNA (cytidine1920-2'-O)/16S rRNA (cytidine1409-2'-O)-methyltransferase
VVKERLDKLITEQRLVRSRSKAQRLIMAGCVRVNGQTVYRPGHLVDSQARIELVAQERYTSRGGEKLEAALAEFRVDPTGKVCLDVGSSTGGFTDCLLQHGARRVHSVDVGRGLLDWRLRNDPRVVVHEGLNARYLDPKDIGEKIELAAVDVSFISLRLVLSPLFPLIEREGEVVALVKPQFEAGKEKVGKGGVVRDAAVHLEVLEALSSFIERETPYAVVAATPSPLLGPAGNIEFFFLLHGRASSGCASVRPDLAALVARAHAGLAECKDEGDPAEDEDHSNERPCGGRRTRRGPSAQDPSS